MICFPSVLYHTLRAITDMHFQLEDGIFPFKSLQIIINNSFIHSNMHSEVHIWQ